MYDRTCTRPASTALVVFMTFAVTLIGLQVFSTSLSTNNVDASAVFAPSCPPPGALSSCPQPGPVVFESKHEVSCPLNELPFPLTTGEVVLDFRQYGVPDVARWRMLVHDIRKDWLSSTVISDQGAQMFENNLKLEFWKALHPTDMPGPKTPLILDVGANIGIHTMYFGALGYRTHAFEPVRSNYALLACSVMANENMQGGRVRINNFGLSNRVVPKQCFSQDPQNQGHSFVDPAHTDCDVSMSTSLSTMDHYWATVLRQERPFLIKVDIEGFEPFFFEGAKAMMKQAPPVYIFMELSPFSSESYGAKVAPFLKGLITDGWKIEIIRGDASFTNGHPTPADNNIDTDEEIADIAGSRDTQIWDIRLTHMPTYSAWKAGNLQF